MKRITIAIVAALALPFTAACEDAGDATDQRAEQAGEMAEEMQEQRLEEGDVYGEIDQEISGEISEERFELIVDTAESQRAAEGEDDGILEAKPE